MAMILPPGTFNDGDREPAPSYGALLVARSEEVTQEAVLEALSAARFTGWVSPALDVLEIVEASEFAVGLAAGRTESSKEKEAVEPGEGVAWTVAVPETPLGHVAGDKTTLRELAASIAETLGTAAIAVLVRKGRSHRLRPRQGRDLGQLRVRRPHPAPR